MKTKDKRDTNAVAEIECPRCHARAGAPCFIRGEPGKSVHGPACHPERRAANQERRRMTGEAGPVERPKGTVPPARGYVTDKGTVVAVSRRARSVVIADVPAVTHWWLEDGVAYFGTPESYDRWRKADG